MEKRSYWVRRVEQVHRSNNANMMYRRYYGGVSVGCYETSYILGYRNLLRYITVNYCLGREAYEVLCYYGIYSNYLPVRAIMTIFGITLYKMRKHFEHLSLNGYLQPKYNRPNCTTYRITPKGVDLLNDCVEYWKLNIQS